MSFLTRRLINRDINGVGEALKRAAEFSSKLKVGSSFSKSGYQISKALVPRVTFFEECITCIIS
jgi:hypothetical protein